jgi:PAS domain S-box-containing protein
MKTPIRILVVDDIPENLKVLSELLRSHGYDVWQAANGRQAIEITRERRPDLVLLDVVLPDINGLEVCRQIKADPSLPDVFVVLISGEATEAAQKAQGLESGADEYIAKPFVPRELLARLRTIARLQQTTAALRAREFHYRNLIDILPDGVALVNPEGVILEANPRAAQMLGYDTPSELLGKTVLQFTPPESPGRARVDLAEALRTGTLRAVEHTVLARDGTKLVVELSAALAAPGADAPELVVVARDVTARKAAEAHLRVQSAALESAANGIVIADRTGDVMWANPAFTRLTGYSIEEVLGRNLRMLKSGKHDRSFYEGLWKTIMAGNTWSAEMINRRKDGTLYTEENMITSVRDERGVITHFIAVKQDITARKATEKLRQVQRDFGTFLSATNDLNAAARRLLEIAVDQHGIDCGAVHLVHEKTGELALAARHRLSALMAKRLSARAAASLGMIGADPAATAFPEKVRVQPPYLRTIPITHDGQLVAALSVGSGRRESISEDAWRAIEAIAAQAGGAMARIRVEQLLHTNQQLLKKTLDGLRSAVFVIDASNHRIVMCNPAATAVFGYSTEELIGRSPAILHVDLASRAEFLDALAAAIERQGFLTDFEFRMKCKDGTTFPTDHSIMPIRDSKGRIQSWVNVVRDITGQKRAEEELRDLSRRIIQVQEAERLRVARDLHDGVNQLLASAMMRLRKVDSTASKLSPATREMLARCNDLLMKSLEENRRIAHNLRPSDLDEFGLATACRNLCKEIEARTSLRIHCNVSNSGERLRPDVELNIFRVVQEALSNVEKHAQARSVRLRLARRKGVLTLRIEDDGQGFVPGSKASGKGKRRGAGVINMRERVAALGGSCSIESAPRRGTIITVTVPGA